MKIYIKPSIEVIKLQTEDAILNTSTVMDLPMSEEHIEGNWSQDKGWSSDNWSSED